MAMTERKKWGLRIAITGLVAIIVGVVVMFTAATPMWLVKGLAILSAVLEMVGLGMLWVADPK
jgi:mannose/fructose/N-acetylgalactosamine-specific phosphotransferase system component IIC